MTTQKDFKRVVRARMQKTGESYTTARAAVLRTGRQGSSVEARSVERRAPSVGSRAPRVERRVPGVERQAPGVEPRGPTVGNGVDLAKLAGMSDSKIKGKTGCNWDRWVWALDQVNASAWPHTEIATYVREKYKVADWWTQAVTVGYERIKGLREKGQRRSGMWETSKSRTIAAAAGTVFKAFKQPALRAKWLSGARPVVRSAVPGKTVRLTWDDGSSVEVYLTATARSKTRVAIQHTRLPDRATADRMKAYWTDRLDDLVRQVAPGHPV